MTGNQQKEKDVSVHLQIFNQEQKTKQKKHNDLSANY